MRNTIFVAIAMVCLVALANAQIAPLPVRIVGRVVDDKEQPVGGASIYLEPEKWTGGFDRFIEAVTAAQDGTFTIERPRTERRCAWRLFVILDKTSPDYYSTIEPPFGLLARKNPLFNGQRVFLKNDIINDFGEVSIQHEYGAVELDASQLITHQMDKHSLDWKHLSIRIRDKSGFLADDASLSIEQLSRSVVKDGTVLLMSLPQGEWSIQIIARSKTIGKTGRFSVASGKLLHVELTK